MPDSADVLIFVEDPGAANYVAPVVSVLEEHGHQTLVLAAGIAQEYLRARGVTIQGSCLADAADGILSAMRPRVLLVGTADNPDTAALALVAAARSSGIPSVGAVDALSNAEYRFRGRSGWALTYAPDWLLVPDEPVKRAYVELGYPAMRVVVCGHPHYDYVLDVGARLAAGERDSLRKRTFPDLSAKQRVVVFVTEGCARVSRAPTNSMIREYGLTGRGIARGRSEIVIEEFLEAIQSVTPRPYLVLRPHPKDSPEDYSAYLNEFDLVHTDLSPLELVYASDLIVGMTSMLLLEAALLGRPTLSILPREKEKEQLASVRIGLTPCVTTRTEARSALTNLLREGSQPVQNNNHRTISSGSVGRIVAFIERLLVRDSQA